MTKKFKHESIQILERTLPLIKKAEAKKWLFKTKDFTIDPETFNFTHPTWHNTWCKGGTNAKETLAIIKRYCSECRKGYGKRDLSFVKIVL